MGGYQISFFDRLGKACGRIGRFGSITKINSQLVGVFDVAFAFGGEAFQPEFEIGFLLGVDLGFKLPDDVLFDEDLFFATSKLFF